MAIIPELSLAVQSSLYAELSKFGQPLTSPIMHQLYCIIKRSMFEMDLFSITDFVDGHINSDGHLKMGSSHIFKNYNRKLTVLSSNMLQGFLWRYCTYSSYSLGIRKAKFVLYFQSGMILF